MEQPAVSADARAPHRQRPIQRRKRRARVSRLAESSCSWLRPRSNAASAAAACACRSAARFGSRPENHEQRERTAWRPARRALRRRRTTRASRCRSSCPSTTAPRAFRCWSTRSRSSRSRAGTRSSSSTTAARTTRSRCAASFAGATSVALTVVNLSRNFGEHNAVMAGLSPRARRVRHQHGRRPAEPAGRGDAGSGATPSRTATTSCTRSSNRRSTRCWRNLGSRFTNYCANLMLDKPKDLYLSSFRCMSAFTRAHGGRAQRARSRTWTA